MMIRKEPTILVVDDDTENRTAIAKALRGVYTTVLETDNGQQALDMINEMDIDILVTDLRLPVLDGVELLKAAKRVSQDVEVIMITGHGTVEVAVEAIKEGAYDFITKPVRKAELLRAVEKAAEKQYLLRENSLLREQIKRGGSKRMIHTSSAMRNIARMIEQVASSSATILITGESGTGKEVIADSIHALSTRSLKPMIKISCAALPDTLLESELFGYEKGAFTGANARKEGRFELAHGGTLFLDEVGEISPAIQVKLLRVLQDGRFERLGGTRTIESDVRILAATNKNLQKEVEEKRFREDLFYRLNVINLRVPPLRERKDDIKILASHFMRLYAERNAKPIEGFSEEALLALTTYDWPGNVRELENAIERAVVLTSGKTIPLWVLPDSISSIGETRHSLSFKVGTPLRDLERQAIEVTLQHTRGDKNLAAQLLGIAPRTIYRHLEKQKEEGARDESSTTGPDTESSPASPESDAEDATGSRVSGNSRTFSANST